MRDKQNPIIVLTDARPPSESVLLGRVRMSFRLSPRKCPHWYLLLSNLSSQGFSQTGVAAALDFAGVPLEQAHKGFGATSLKPSSAASSAAAKELVAGAVVNLSDLVAFPNIHLLCILCVVGRPVAHAKLQIQIVIQISYSHPSLHIEIPVHGMKRCLSGVNVALVSFVS